MRKIFKRNYQYHLIIVFALSIICIIIYSNTLNSPFVFDDLPHIKENPYFRLTSLNFQKLYNAAFKSPNSTRPLANISFALNYYFGGYDVRGYHVVNIIIHLINGILVYFLSLSIFRQIPQISNQKMQPSSSVSVPLMSWFVALIFITHPIQAQSVTYIDQRMNSLAAMFYLLSFLLYIHGRLSRITWRRCALFCSCFVSWIMALCSKEIAATLPLIILLYEWYFFQDLQLDWLKRNIIYFLGLVAILGLGSFIYLGKSPIDEISAYYAIRDFTMWERVLTQFRVVVFYISLLFYPHPSRLNLLHNISTSHSLFAPITTLLSLAALIGLIGLAVYLARRYRLISFCILWFFINLIIESSVIGLEMIYEYRLYLPIVGFALFLVYFLFGLLSKRQFWVVSSSVIVILFLCVGTFVRNSVWRDSITLWSDVISKNPQSYWAHNNLGIALNEQGRLDEAIKSYSEAMRIKPYYAVSYYNIGKTLDKQGHLNKAIDYYAQAVQIKPDYSEAHNNLGVALVKQGRHKEAIDHFLQALRIKPNFVKAHNNLGVALSHQGRINEAVDHYLKAVQIDPDYAYAQFNMGKALDRQGHLQEAIKHFLQAIRIKPDYAEAHNNLGIALFRKGDISGAITYFKNAIRIKPDFIQARNNLKNALIIQQKDK